MPLTNSVSFGEDYELYDFVKDIAKKEFNGNRSAAHIYIIKTFRQQKNAGNAILVPTITDVFETHILPFLQNATDEQLDNCRRNAKLTYFNSMAYRELPQDKRPTKQFAIMDLMDRYSY